LSHYETIRVARDGKQVAVSVSVAPIRNAAGRVVAASTIMRDITEQRHSAAALEDRQQRMRAILDTAADAIVTIDERGTIESVNPATERLFGYREGELVGRNVKSLMPEPFYSEHDGYLRRYLRTGQARIIGVGREVTGLRKDASTFPMNLSVSEVRVGRRRLFTGIVHDLTERRRLERQIMETAANEQRRIGQDLHDGLCQDLIGIAFGIDALARSALTDELRKPVENLAASIREAAGQARRLAHGLNPVDLKAGGLAIALENLAVKVSDSFRIRCAFVWDRVAHVREDATATHLYRIAQEAVGNAIRHGQATLVKISLFQRSGGAVVLSIEDNGKGMRRAIAERVKQGLVLSDRNKPTGGIGLQTMHYRARVIGGTFAVAPRRGRGTIVTCTIGREASHTANAPSYPRSEKVLRNKRTPSR
jgi:PAS domain S-box-containing protein